MKVTVIGAKDRVGTYLVPLLVESGHEVTAVSRGALLPEWPVVCTNAQGFRTGSYHVDRRLCFLRPSRFVHRLSPSWGRLGRCQFSKPRDTLRGVFSEPFPTCG